MMGTRRSEPLSLRVGLALLRVHQATYEATDGRIGHGLLGVPCLLLRTTGRRTGKPRTSSLVYARDGGDYLVVGSLGGSDRAPAWLHNVEAQPDVSVQIARDRFPARARIITPEDDDYQRLWRLVNDDNRGRYDRYQAKTERPIPVVRLTPQYHQGRFGIRYGGVGVVPVTEKFSGVTVVLPAVTETDSLDQTARQLQETSDADIAEVIAVVCDRTTPESLARCEALAEPFGARLRIHHQRLPFLGGAMREAFDLATASHVVMMASDLETDPAVVPEFTRVAKQQPNVIVTASRWASGGGFTGYGPGRVAANWVFQRLTSVIYRTHLTDATFGYRLFPTALVQAIRWEGLRHEFLLETVLKPLRLGVEVVEVPTFWTPRREGESQNSLSTQARYVRTLFAERVQPPSRMLRRGPAVTTP